MSKPHTYKQSKQGLCGSKKLEFHIYMIDTESRYPFKQFEVYKDGPNTSKPISGHMNSHMRVNKREYMS